jgi:hypothetical protein
MAAITGDSLRLQAAAILQGWSVLSLLRSFNSGGNLLPSIEGKVAENTAAVSGGGRI